MITPEAIGLPRLAPSPPASRNVATSFGREGELVPLPPGRGAMTPRLALGRVLTGELEPSGAFAAAGLSPEAFIDRAMGEGCAGLLLQAMEGSACEWKRSVMDVLRGAVNRDAARVLRTLHASERILAGMAASGVDVLVLKGVALHATVYSSPGLRPLTDLDLLVRPKDVPRAVAVLTGLGCQRGMDLIRADFFPTYYYETEFLSPPPAHLRIDLHVQPLRPPRYARLMPVEAMWEDSQRVTLGRAPLLIPSPERMLIHLAAHAAFHGCSRLIWLHDLRAQAACYARSLDWSRFVERTCAWRLTAAVRSAFDAAEHFLGPILPEPIRDDLHRRSAGWADRVVLRSAPREAGSPLRTVLVHLLTTPGLRWKWGYALAHLLPSTEHLRQSYARRHFGWTTVAHANRLLRHAQALIKVLRGPFRGRRKSPAVPPAAANVAWGPINR